MMQRKTRILLRAARFLEFEAQEYIEAAKTEDPDGQQEFGRRAKRYIGTAFSVRQIASSGYAPTVKSEEAAGKREVLFFGTLARHYA